jgi:hypothetical protein
VKFPFASIDPAVADHVTPDESLVTMGVNCTVWPAPMAAICGLMATVVGALLAQPVAKRTPQTTNQKSKETHLVERCSWIIHPSGLRRLFVRAAIHRCGKAAPQGFDARLLHFPGQPETSFHQIMDSPRSTIGPYSASASRHFSGTGDSEFSLVARTIL